MRHMRNSFRSSANAAQASTIVDFQKAYSSVTFRMSCICWRIEAVDEREYMLQIDSQSNSKSEQKRLLSPSQNVISANLYADSMEWVKDGRFVHVITERCTFAPVGRFFFLSSIKVFIPIPFNITPETEKKPTSIFNSDKHVNWMCWFTDTQWW